MVGAQVSAFVGELYVLGLRAIMPIHVICAGFQAINYVKVRALCYPSGSTSRSPLCASALRRQSVPRSPLFAVHTSSDHPPLPFFFSKLLQEVVEDRRMSVPRLLLPAILLHGTFDFILMAMAMIQYCYGLSEGLFNVLSLAVGTWHFDSLQTYKWEAWWWYGWFPVYGRFGRMLLLSAPGSLHCLQAWRSRW